MLRRFAPRNAGWLLMGWQREVLDYWFGLKPEQWWFDQSIDEDVSERFKELWEQQRRQPVDAFLASPEDALAAVILFDQFPRNMFRDHADSFSTDHLGLAIAKEAIARGYDEGLPPERRQFLYVPFQHSERLEDQERSVQLYTALGDQKGVDFAVKHRDIIARFGRFPHRNAILGRAPRPGEIPAGDVKPF